MDSINNISSSDTNIIDYDSSLLFNYFTILLKELYIILSNMENTEYEVNELNEFINNFLFEYDLDPNNVLEIMTSTSQNILYYSSLIGFFYQHGIGCEIDKVKALEIYFNTIKNNQTAILNQFTFDEKNETIFFCNDDIKELNGMITQYFHSLFLYEDIMLDKKSNYKFYIKSAENGDSASQYCIGNWYYIKKDYNKAIEWYSKSSEGGNIKAMYALGCCYEYEYGVMKDERKAFELYLKSAEGGYKHALNELGGCYYNGNCTFKNKNKAFEFYLKAAEKGHASSQYLVANYYFDGICIPKDEGKWFYWNRKAAINGITDAQLELAEYYTNKNEGKAFKWYIKLANENNLKAIYTVAKCYRDGIGTNKNLKEGLMWFRRYMNLI
jgi:TPR repeat protein